MNYFMRHFKVRYPKGVTLNDKLFLRFSIKEREGTRFLGLDENGLLFALPNTTVMSYADCHCAVHGGVLDGCPQHAPTGEQVTFKFVSTREYGTYDVSKLTYLGKSYGCYVWLEA